jgi:hypothetical protein
VEVTLKIRLEPTGDADSPFVWWADVDDMPGFSAAADHLPDLLRQAKAAVEELLSEPVEIRHKVVFVDDESGADSVSVSPRRHAGDSAPAVEVRQMISRTELQPA